MKTQYLDLLKKQLAQLATQANFESIITTAFGTNIEPAKILQLRQQWLQGDFSVIPPIEILDGGELGAANGGYAASEDKIFISSGFLAQQQGNSNAITGLLLEELGHKLDRVFNGNVDSPGDEGEIFSRLASGQKLSPRMLASLKAEEDRAVITVGGKAISIEQQVIKGTDSGDYIYGGVDDDTLYGYGGNDILYGNAGRDVLIGGYGNDDLYGGSDNDRLFGDVGNDYLYGGTGNDFLSGGIGDDYLYGDVGNDVLYGESGNDFLSGGSGNDTYEFGIYTLGTYGVKIIDEATDTTVGGTDTLDFSSLDIDQSLNIDLSKTTIQTVTTGLQLVIPAISIENIIGGLASSTLVGNSLNNVLRGGSGKDYLSGGSGNDELYGWNSDDYLYGGDNNDKLFGGSENDYLSGDAGNDFLHGGSGINSLYGGTGDDNYYIGVDDTGIDTIYETTSDGIDTLDFSQFNKPVSFDLGQTTSQTVANGLQIVIPSVTIENIDGSAVSDNLSGNNLSNLLRGNGGDDTISGLNGNDSLYGGDNNDNLYGGDGNDSLYGEAGNDSLYGGVGNDILSGGTGSDKFYFGFSVSPFPNAGTAPTLGRDTIVDFVSGTDKIVLIKSTFSGITTSLGMVNFATVADDTVAVKSSAAILYSASTGNLFYNQNGTLPGLGANGSNFATLTGLPNLVASDFIVI
jgi:Ca2+-binding RTX toxin-like protein